MKKLPCRLLSLCLSLLLLVPAVSALADGGTDYWTCPVCGEQWNHGNYCFNCSAPRPASIGTAVKSGKIFVGWYTDDGEMIYDANGRAVKSSCWSADYNAATWQYSGAVALKARWAAEGFLVRRAYSRMLSAWRRARAAPKPPLSISQSR